jgi:hypothetical protein
LVSSVDERSTRIPGKFVDAVTFEPKVRRVNRQFSGANFPAPIFRRLRSAAYAFGFASGPAKRNHRATALRSVGRRAACVEQAYRSPSRSRCLAAVDRLTGAH